MKSPLFDRLLALAIAAGVAACGGASPEARHAGLQRGPRDIVVILVDTLRADRLGTYGYDRPTSPHIDAFAKSAIVFDRCVSQSTWTKPSVASFLTGLLPAEHGVHRTNSPLDRRLTTVAERLREQGYQSAGFVANKLVSGSKHGMGQGFDVFEGKFEGRSSDLYPRAGSLVDRSLEWLEGVSDDPFFLYVHFYDPHVPYDPPEPQRGSFDRGFAGSFDGAYSIGDPDAKPEHLGPDDWEHWRDLYDAEIAYADEHIGRLLEGLKQRGRFEDTLIVFLSDHGEEFFEHGDWGHNPKMYQEVVHVPLIVKPPLSLGLETGRRVDQLVMQIDFVPTVLDLLGEQPDPSLLGESWFARSLLGSEALRATAYSEVRHHGHIRRGVFEGDWKRIRADAPTRADHLFHLGQDPHERDDRFLVPGAPLEHLDRLLSSFEERGPQSKTLAIELSNQGTNECRLILRVAADPPIVGLDPYQTEEKAGVSVETRDGPLTVSEESWPGHSLTTASISLCLPPGDTDRILVDLATGCDSVWIQIDQSNGAFDSTQLLLGAAGTPIAALPCLVDLNDPGLLRDEPGQVELVARGSGTNNGMAGRVWLVPSGALRPIDLSAEERHQIEQLGYSADD